MTLVKRLERSNRYQREATMTKDEAIAWAKAHAERTKRWPRKRWRVESPHGNTRFLTLGAAEVAQQRYNGSIVEIIPTATELGLPKMTLNQTRTEGLPACPKCGAAIGEPCRTPRKKLLGIDVAGDSRPPHKERVDAAKPPPPPPPPRMWVHQAEAPPHTSCPSTMMCNCTCRFCRKAWKDEKKPGAPRPARGQTGAAPEPWKAYVKREHGETGEPGAVA